MADFFYTSLAMGAVLGFFAGAVLITLMRDSTRAA